MSNGTYRGRWVDEVFQTSHISAEVKVFLLFLANYYMEDGGRVSEPRENLAKHLGCHPRNVTAKFKAAIAAGLLKQTVRGQKHQTAVYQAVIPNMPQGDGSHHPERPQGDGFYHPEPVSQGDDTRHPETPQGDSSRHPETSQGDDCRHPTYKRPVQVSDNGEVAVVLHLFDEEPPSAGAATPRTGKRQNPVQAVVAAYIEGVKEATGERPDRRRIGHISKQAKILLEEEKRDPARLAEAARALGHKVGRGFTDLGQEYLITAAMSRQAATGTTGHGYRPYRNPQDQSVYDERL